MSTKNYVVVGGSKGIGHGIVRRLLNDGHHVTVLSRTWDHQDLDVNHIIFDVALDDLNSDQLPGEIHGLVYCPGSINLKPFRALSPDAFRQDFELNVVGAIRVVQAGLNAVKASGSGSIVMFSTVAVGQGMPAHASIAASKGAIEALTRTLAAEFSPDVRVNCIAPALTNTPLTARFFSDEARAAALGEKYPLARTGTVDDIAAAACFLLSPDSSWMTGQILAIDGGLSSVRK
ncbi:MAG: SDR family oxidoreductase [Fuerstiella sp.]